MTESGILPKELAEYLFTQDPQPEKSIRVLCLDEKDQTLEPIFLFEIFLNILTEGIFIKHGPITSEKYMTFDENIINAMSPWLRSVGFDTIVEKYPRYDETIKKHFRKYYCQIILKCDPEWEMLFNVKNIPADFHYVLGGKSPFQKGKNCNLENTFAILTVGDVVYKITFKCI
jgi:hypothetical protein